MGRVLVTDIALLADAIKAHGSREVYLLGSPISDKHAAKAAGLPSNRIMSGDEESVLLSLGAVLFKPEAKVAAPKKAAPKKAEPVLEDEPKAEE